MRHKLQNRTSRLANVRTGVIVAAAAATAAASAWDRTHRRVQRADLTESHLRVERLSDLRHEKQALAEIEAYLRDEWGPFALLGFKSIDEMAAEAGRTIFVVMERDEEGTAIARAIVQTILTDVHGDASLLAEAYPTFAALTSRESWKSARQHGGDTAVLLQITTLSDRGGGTGSLLRNAVLNMLDRSVKYALTTTPIDGAEAGSIDPEDVSSYTAAMRFHARGGANPALVLPAYKRPEDGAEPTSHGFDIVVMRYARDAEGLWPATRPLMRIRSVGPFQDRLSRAFRRLRLRRLRNRRFFRRRRAIDSRDAALASGTEHHVPGLFRGIKAGAARIARRSGPPAPPVAPTSV